VSHPTIPADQHATFFQPEPPKKKSHLKRNLLIAAGVVAVAAVASNAGHTKVDTAPAATSTAAPTAAPAAAKAPSGPDKSPRGNLMYAAGQPVVVKDKGGKEVARITVNEVKVAATCPGSLAAYDKDPRAVVLLNATVTTGPDLTSTLSDTFGLNPFMMSVVTDAGQAVKSTSAFGCVDAAEGLSLIGAGQSQTGWLALKTDSPHGHVIFRHPGLDGVEWQY
jgi:hypothetical protein